MTLPTPEALAHIYMQGRLDEWARAAAEGIDHPDVEVAGMVAVRSAVIEALIADAEAAGDNDNVLCFYDDQDGQFHPESPSSLAAYLRRYLQGDESQ